MDCQKPAAEAVLESNSRTAILTSRRSGKSYCILSVIIHFCITNPEAQCLYIGLTRQSVKRIGWKLAKKICNKHKISYTENKSSLTITFNNESTLEFGSVQNNAEADKYLGTYYDIVGIDEAASYDPDVLDYLVDEVLDPALAEVDGRVVLLGTPREIEGGRFFDTTALNLYPTWNTFRWKTEENIYLADAWKRKIEQIKRDHPDVDIFDIPKIKREYLGEWAKEDAAYVYRVKKEAFIDQWNPDKPEYVLGIDIGFRDACAFVVGGWDKHKKEYVVVYSYKKSGMLYDDIANKIEELTYQYKNIREVVVDAAGGAKVIQESLANRFKIPVTAAEKTEKSHWVEVFNTEMILGNIKILEESNKELIEEMLNLPWKQKNSGKWEEHPDYDNHATDACLYGYRYAYHYLEEPLFIKTEEDRMWEEVERKIEKRAKLRGRKHR